ncbi:nucleoside deaminase [Alphaproteobacteria bacterium]|nr:nucleoside deaminase [Alphaproteobacteria bacterium]MDB2477732.1 nucleoside deaminase [Alphaproteobacteria bacterium]MDB2541204.1 nucleoside deaminase [Alphaproteobacteria bacterium]MDB2676852.1 nucleoside deaminase [Alphaproteobacteria bacterium]
MSDDFMQMALDEAHAAAAAGEVPVGAVLVSAQGAVLARTGNQMRALNDPTAHAEIAAIRQACETLGNERLSGCSLYVTLEPCPMCAGAIAEARIAKLFYGAADVKGGAVDNGVALFDQKSCHHKPEVIGGLRESDCAALLKDFFALRRNG